MCPGGGVERNVVGGGWVGGGGGGGRGGGGGGRWPGQGRVGKILVRRHQMYCIVQAGQFTAETPYTLLLCGHFVLLHPLEQTTGIPLLGTEGSDWTKFITYSNTHTHKSCEAVDL